MAVSSPNSSTTGLAHLEKCHHIGERVKENINKKKKRESLLWPGASKWRIYYHRMCVQLSTSFSNLLKYPNPNGELLAAVDHNQLRTMASETVDPIAWPHPPPYTGHAVPPELHVLHSVMRAANHKTCCNPAANVRPSECQANALPVRSLRVKQIKQ